MNYQNHWFDIHICQVNWTLFKQELAIFAPFVFFNNMV
jgi:hypothetical protein